MPSLLHLLRLRQTDLSFGALRLQEQRGLKLVCGIVRIFEAEVNLTQQQPRGKLSRREFQAGFEGVAGAG